MRQAYLDPAESLSRMGEGRQSRHYRPGAPPRDGGAGLLDPGGQARVFFLRFFFLDVDHFLKVFIVFVAVLLPSYVLVFWP